MPRGRNANLGITVVFPSIKFNDAQKLPDRTLMRSIQTESMLHRHKIASLVGWVGWVVFYIPANTV